MRVLVVHDRDPIRSEIVDVLRVEDAECDVVERSNYNEARGALHATDGNYFDLMILDLTLPINEFDSIPPTVENAQNLLAELFDGSDLVTPGDVIGISNDIPAVEKTENLFSEQLLMLLKEGKDDDWKSRLVAKLRYLRKAIAARSKSEITEYGVDAMIITALDKEAVPYQEIFELDDREAAHDIRRFVFTDKNDVLRNGILFSVGQAGQAPTASATQALLSKLRPRVALMSGYCGGIRDKLNLLDVVAFNSSYAWDNGKWVLDKSSEKPLFKPRPYPIAADGEQITRAVRDFEASDFLRQPELVDRAAELAADLELQSASFHSKPAGSGSAVVSEAFIAESIRNLNDDIWAVDMESYGFYYACKNTKTVRPQFLCVKSVSDYCDPEKNDKVQAACSYLSARTVKCLITAYLNF